MTLRQPVFHLVKSTTEEFLYFLLWTAESFLRPTWCNLDETFESWAYRNRLGRRLAVLERDKLIERTPAGRVCRLTAEGRRLALGGRDPLRRWERPWDGRWRLVLFDLPVNATATRSALRRFLLRHSFGYLQQSVWITPDGLAEVRRLLRKLPADVESLMLMEGRPCGGESDAAIVRGAWDFPRINGLYEQHQAVLRDRPEIPTRHTPPTPEFRAWARCEREVWKAAVRRDPLLPRALLPPAYRGREAWAARRRLFRQLHDRFWPEGAGHSDGEG